MPRRKLTKAEIGEGFWGNLWSGAKNIFKKHAKKHVTAAISHGKKIAKAKLAEVKTRGIAMARQKLAEGKAHAKAAIHAKIQEVKRRAVKKVQTHVCGSPKVGAGFFDGLAAKAKAHAHAQFEGLHKKAISHISGAKSAAQEALHAHKDKVIATVHKKVDSVKQQALRKARSVAGCEGSGLNLRGAGVRKRTGRRGAGVKCKCK